MQPSFEQTWRGITSTLKPGMEISNWTVLKGNTSGKIKIVSISEDSIFVDSLDKKSVQRVKKEKMELIWNVWEDYKKGRIQRQQMQQNNFHSTYIISILQWWDMNLNS